MNQEIQWFLHIIETNKLLSKEEIVYLYKSLHETNITLDECAQAALDIKTDSITSEEEANTIVKSFEEARLTAIAKAVQNTPIPQITQTGTKKMNDCFETASSLSEEDTKYFLKTLLSDLKKNGTSDLHISAGAVPFVRKSLKTERISNTLITPDLSAKLNTAFLDHQQMLSFSNDKALSYCLSFSEKERYRVSLINQKDGISGSYHIVPGDIQPLKQLGFSEANIAAIEYFLSHHNGLILVTGPIGNGKTTTLASLVDILNKNRKDHIIMIEHPIEIVQSSLSCNVTQREVKKHTAAYSSAIRAALREDPDIIVIGELSDLETIEIAITASETGHIVIGTMQTGDATNTMNRIINIFPPLQQPQIRAMLAGSLRGIICQRLLPAKNEGVTLAAEIMVNTLAISNTINEGKMHLLKQTIQTSTKSGMISMDASILSLYTAGKISKETALQNVTDKKNYEKLITG